MQHTLPPPRRQPCVLSIIFYIYSRVYAKICASRTHIINSDKSDRQCNAIQLFLDWSVENGIYVVHVMR
jgi:hypothetical protein